MTSGLARLNALADADAVAGFLRCCGSARWATEMSHARPYASADELFAKALDRWADASTDEQLEAYAHHPRIGAIGSQRAGGEATAAWAKGEQRGASVASDDVKERLAAGNAAYEAKFGHVYLVCATGKTGDELLAILEERLTHDAETELRIAAEEQAKITRIRLEKWLNEADA